MSDSKQWHGGKGSYRRNENKEAYESNWDKIFGTKTTVIKAEDFGGVYSEEDVIFNKQVESKDLEDNTADLRAQTWKPEVQQELPNVTTKLIGNEGHDSLPDIENSEYFEESAMDRYERHMKPIRKAQANAETPSAHFPPFNDA